MNGQQVFERLSKMTEEERRNVTIPYDFTMDDAKDIIDEIRSNGLLWERAPDAVYDALDTIPDETLAGMFAKATETVTDEDYAYVDGVRDKVRYGISDYMKEHYGKSNRLCPHCGRLLGKSDNERYAWQCMECDEDFYDFETAPAANCAWCNDLFPLDELKKERNMGLLCDECIQAIRSRGEKLVIEDN